MTTRVNRAEFLSVLESVSAGLASREILQQSTCIVFQNGKVFSFNDEIACSRKSPINIEGAVAAKPLLDLLSKLKEDEIEIDADGSEFTVRGKGKKAGIRMEAEVLLPVESIEAADEWIDIPKDFADAISIVCVCASTEESTFVLTCVNITPNHLEASDRFQICRYPMETGVSSPTLVRAASLKKLANLDMTHMSETDSWLHFKNAAGLTLSCRRYVDEYPDLGKFIDLSDFERITLPGGLEEVVSAAQIFSSENSNGDLLAVDLRKDRIVIEGSGAKGYYKEMKKVKFTGDPIKFMIAPKLLLEITKKSNECSIAPGRLAITSGKFSYLTCTNVANDTAEEPASAE
jgi:DNA polymerase III sliding clamp (beta) subunit (PCNA family)